MSEANLDIRPVRADTTTEQVRLTRYSHGGG